MSGLAQQFLATNDFYGCIAKRYLNYLTGYDVMLAPPNPDIDQYKTDQQKELENFHRDLTRFLKDGTQSNGETDPQTMKGLINKIVRSKFFFEEIEMSKKISRRIFLKTGAVSSLLLSTNNPLGILFNQIMNSTAHAQSPAAKRFISFVILGAPPRWMYDLILNVGGLPADVNAMTSTNFSGNPLAPVYQTTGTKTTSDGVIFQPPVIWDSTLSDGDSNFMPSLLNKMMSIMCRQNNWESSTAKLATHVHILSKAGVHTLAQEQTSNTAPATCVQYGVNFPFNARNEISNLTVKYDDSEDFNPIEEILKPFLKEHTPDKDFSSNLSDIFDEAFDAFLKGDKIKTFSDGAKESIKSSQENAKLLFIGATKDLIDSYPTIYQNIKQQYTIK